MKADRKAEALSERGGELDDTHPTDPYLLGYLDVFESSRGAERSDSPGPLGQHLDACAHCRGRIRALAEHKADVETLAAELIIESSDSPRWTIAQMLARTRPRSVAFAPPATVWPELDAISSWLLKGNVHPADQIEGIADDQGLDASDLLIARTELKDIGTEARLLESRAQDLCREIEHRFRHALVAFQVIHPHKRVVENIAATGEAQAWVGASQHSLPLRGLRDIQADVAMSKMGEVISGEDERLDRYLFRVYGHKDAIRAFVPVAIARGKGGQLVAARWKKVSGALKVVVDAEPGTEIEVIGTLECGYLKPGNRTITADDLLGIVRVASEHALSIYASTFRPVLERVGGLIMKLTGSPSASVHLLRERYAPPPADGGAHELYSYHVWAGRSVDVPAPKDSERAGAISALPRHRGLGSLALEDGRALVVPDAQSEWPALRTRNALADFNPVIWNQGVRAMGVFPIEESDLHGLIYFHRFEESTFSRRRMRAIEKFVRREVARELKGIFDAVEERERSRQFAALNRLLLYCARVNTQQPLLEDLAWQARTVLGADLVLIKVRSNGRWSPASIVGQTDPVDIDDRTADHLCQRDRDVQGGVFEADARPFFESVRGTVGTGLPGSDAVVSAAVHALPGGGAEPLGVMYVGFSSYRAFHPGEREILRQVARVTAVVVQGQPPGEARFDALARKVVQPLTTESGGVSRFGNPRASIVSN